MEDILTVADEMQINIEAEADAVHKYDHALQIINDSALDQATKEQAINTITEIISDELNHMEKLHKTYTLLTGIEPNKD